MENAAFITPSKAPLGELKSEYSQASERHRDYHRQFCHGWTACSPFNTLPSYPEVISTPRLYFGVSMEMQ
jgi:hypothetical protein